MAYKRAASFKFVWSLRVLDPKSWYLVFLVGQGSQTKYARQEVTDCSIQKPESFLIAEAKATTLPCLSVSLV